MSGNVTPRREAANLQYFTAVVVYLTACTVDSELDRCRVVNLSRLAVDIAVSIDALLFAASRSALVRWRPESNSNEAVLSQSASIVCNLVRTGSRSTFLMVFINFGMLGDKIWI